MAMSSAVAKMPPCRVPCGIEQEVGGIESHLAGLAGVGDLQPQEPREEEVAEALPLAGGGALEGGARLRPVDPAGHPRLSSMPA